MRTLCIMILLGIMSSTVGHSQTIESKKVFGGYQFSQAGKTLTETELSSVLESNQQSKDLRKKARANQTFAMIVSGIGGGLVGYPLGTAIGGGEPNWVVAGVGAGLIVVAIPISISAHKKTKQAVEVYNTSITEPVAFVPQFSLMANQKGIGLSLGF